MIISASANNEVSRGKIPIDWRHLDLGLESQKGGGGEEGKEEDEGGNFKRGFTAYTDDEFELATHDYKSDSALSDVKFWTAQVPLLSCLFHHELSTVSLSSVTSVFPFSGSFILFPLFSLCFLAFLSNFHSLASLDALPFPFCRYPSR